MRRILFGLALFITAARFQLHLWGFPVDWLVEAMGALAWAYLGYTFLWVGRYALLAR